MALDKSALLELTEGVQTFCTPLARESDSRQRRYDQRADFCTGTDQRADATTGVDHRDEATTGVDHREEAVAWDVANEEARSDARAMKPTVNAVAMDLRINTPLLWPRSHYEADEFVTVTATHREVGIENI